MRPYCWREYVFERIRDSPYANHDGYVPFGKLVDYAGGRSDGCTSWSPSDARQIIPMVKDNPTTLYIYPESRPTSTPSRERWRPVGRRRAAGLYWNASCLKEIGSPKFWPKGNPRADPRSIQEGSSGTAATANADLQEP